MYQNIKCYAVIAAGGAGVRLGSKTPKQFLTIEGKPVVAHALQKFAFCEAIDGIVLIAPKGMVAFCEEMISCHAIQKIMAVVEGGGERQYSVFEGLKALPAEASIVLIHDGVRPFVGTEDIMHIIDSTALFGGAVLAVPVKETVKIADKNLDIMQTPKREMLYLAQTPQGFKREMIMEAYEMAERDGFLGSDDSSLVERMGIWPRIVVGSYDNIKITTPEDLLIAEALLK